MKIQNKYILKSN